MLAIETVIARVAALREDCRNHGIKYIDDGRNPAYEHGILFGRDAAFAIVLQEIQELLEKDAQSEED
jgi:hypothetical protein